MGNVSARRALGLPKFAQICYGILSFLLSLWDKSDEPNISNDTFFEGYAGMKEGKRERSLYGRKVRGPRRVRQKEEEAQEHSRRYKQRMTEAYGKTIKERMFTERQLVLRTANHVR